MTVDITGSHRRTAHDRLRAAWAVLALPLISIVLALIVGAFVIQISQLIVPGGTFDPGLTIRAYGALFRGAFTGDGLVNTLISATPLIFGGLSVALAFKAGLFNIGAQGQFLLGALGAVWMGVIVSDQPALVAILLALGAAMLFGGFWGFIPGVLKAVSGAHEVVTTIMLNYIAVAVVAAVVSGPLDQPGSPSPITADVGNAALPTIIGRTGHAGILLAVAAAAVIWVLLYRTTRGFEIRTVGANPDAARYAGMRPRYLIVLVMSMAGALAGLAGAAVVLGVTHLMTASFGGSVGFDSIAVALLGRSSPVGVIFSALLFGAMRAGSTSMQITARVPAELVDVLQALILLFLVAGPYVLRVFGIGGVKVALEGEQAITRSYGGEGAVR